jgi:hypothetical protein
VQGRPDFLHKDVIIEIKSTSTFFKLIDFHQVLLYYFMIKLSRSPDLDYPKKALIYYSIFNQTIEFEIESLITDEQMKKTEKSLVKYFKNIQNIEIFK